MKSALVLRQKPKREFEILRCAQNDRLFLDALRIAQMRLGKFPEKIYCHAAIFFLNRSAQRKKFTPDEFGKGSEVAA
jgi:hypothetical protein